MKKLKYYVAILFISLAISCPVMAENTAPAQESQPKVEQQAQLPVRRPTSKKALAYKFIMAMLGVGASSVIIYVLLTIYNRFIYGSPMKLAEKTEDDDYKTPTNMKDAINIFLKKTK